MYEEVPIRCIHHRYVDNGVAHILEYYNYYQICSRENIFERFIYMSPDYYRQLSVRYNADIIYLNTEIDTTYYNKALINNVRVHPLDRECCLIDIIVDKKTIMSNIRVLEKKRDLIKKINTIRSCI
jgi:hypothetical protein